jgi:hypothetical protein
MRELNFCIRAKYVKAGKGGEYNMKEWNKN